jgi:predicted alpha/beta superfamily hydrolase
MSIKVRCLLLFLIFSPFIQAQHHVTEYDSVYSVHLKELRQIKISIPKKYDANSKEKLDVLYVLDGEWATSLSETVYEFLEYAQFIPTNMIIVSIPNYYKDGVNMRRRDFIPSQTKTQAVPIGTTNFLSFLQEELIPFIDEKYPTNTENNILYGSSLGGLFTVYTYLEKPTLFKSYISIEPVLRLGENYISKIASERFEKIKDSKNTLWISSRDGKAFKEMGIAQFESLLALKAPKNLHWKVAAYPNETHFSAIWKGIYDGLKFTYTKSKTSKKIMNRADLTNE